MNTSARPHYDSIFRPGLFHGQIHVVTGGGSGIGRCVAHELAHLGATVVITGRNPDKLAQVTGEIREDGGQVDSFAFDIRDEEQVKAAISAQLERGASARSSSATARSSGSKPNARSVKPSA